MDRLKPEKYTLGHAICLTLLPLGFTIANGIFLFAVDSGVDCIYQDNNSTTNSASLFSSTLILLIISSVIATITPTLKYLEFEGILFNIIDGIHGLLTLAAIIMMHVVRLDAAGRFCSGTAPFDQTNQYYGALDGRGEYFWVLLIIFWVSFGLATLCCCGALIFTYCCAGKSHGH